MGLHEREQRIVATWDFDDPAASFDAFAAAADAAGPTSAEGLVLRTQQARALGLQRRTDEADQVLDGVSRDAEHGDLDAAESSHVAARTEIERGRVLNSSGSPAEARPLFKAAHEHALEAGLEGLAIDALHMRAIVAGRTDGPAAAAALNAQAISFAEDSSDPGARRWIATLLNNLGWDRHDAGAHEEALDIFRRALATRLEQGTPREIEVARWCVARCLRSLERYGQALDIQERLAESDTGSEDGYVYEEIGENLIALGRGDESAAYFSRAHELLSDDEWPSDDEAERLERQLFLPDD